jgi:putative transcriptional regulator
VLEVPYSDTVSRTRQAYSARGLLVRDDATPYITIVTPLSLRLKEVRLAKGLSQKALADAAGIRRASVSDIEKGKTKGIDFDTLDRLATALGVNAAALIDHQPAKPRKK